MKTRTILTVTLLLALSMPVLAQTRKPGRNQKPGQIQPETRPGNQTPEEKQRPGQPHPEGIAAPDEVTVAELDRHALFGEIARYPVRVGKTPYHVRFRIHEGALLDAMEDTQPQTRLRRFRNEAGALHHRTTNAEGMTCGTIDVNTPAADFNEFYVDPAGTEQFVANIVPGVIYDFSEIQQDANYNVVEEHDRRAMELWVNEPANFRTDRQLVKKPQHIGGLNSTVGAIKRSAIRNGGAHVSPTVKEIYTEDDLYLHLSAGGTFLTASLGTDLEFDRSSNTWWYLYDYIEPYFTISTSVAQNGFFKDSTFTPDPAWVYVKSVTYGRRLTILIETTEDLSKTSTDIEGDVSALLFNIEAGVHSDVQHRIETATVRGYVYGGSVPLANELAAVLSTREWDRINDALENYIENGATRATDAKPLSYELADLQGNVVEAEIDPFERSVRKCTPATRTYEIALEKITVNKAGDALDTPNYLELYGSVRYDAYDEAGQRIPSDGERPPVPMLDGAMLYYNNFIFADEDDPIDIGIGATEVLNNPVRTFTMPIDENKAYFKLSVNAADHDKNSPNDVYPEDSTGKIKVEDLISVETSFSVEVDDSKKHDEAIFTFVIKKIYD